MFKKRHARNTGIARARFVGKIVLLLIIASLMSYRFTGYPDINPFRPERIEPPWGEMTAMDSVLVIAPHCDDETLGCGGLLSSASAQGSRVQVVVMTNGDGFSAAARLKAAVRRLSAERYTQLGDIRQRETLSALRTLGVDDRNVMFLGYPDGGLAKLWLQNWDYANLFTSRYTKAESSPYPSSFTLNAPYCGRAVVDDLCQIIAEFSPSLVFMPHPNDAHPDHWATFALATAALHRLASQGKLDPGVRTFTYIIHRGDWPVPRLGMLHWRLDPPSTLRHMPFEWIYLPLHDDTVLQKRRAVLEYRSQVAIMRMYMLSFVRQNELFTAVRSPIAGRLGEWGASEVNRDTFWLQAEPVALDPLEDTIGRRLSGAADLSSVSAALSGDTLYLMIKARAGASTAVRYAVNMCDFADERTMATFNIGPGYALSASYSSGAAATAGAGAVLDRSPGSAGAGLRLRRTARGIELAIPLQVFGGGGVQPPPDEVFFTVQSSVGGIGLDRTGWTVLRLQPDAPGLYR